MSFKDIIWSVGIILALGVTWGMTSQRVTAMEKDVDRLEEALILFTKILANKLNEKNITVNSIHPGLIGTNLLSKNGWISPFLNILLKLFGKSTKTGAKGLIYLATSDDIKQLTGKYFEGVNITKLLNHADDMKSAKKLWDISSKLCGLNTDLLID